MKRAVCLVVLLCALAATAARAQNQFLSPGRPQQDPCGAFTCWAPVFTTDSSFQGSGATITPSGCLVETHSVWLRLDVVQSGTIVFTITPNNPLNDYDFAVFQSNNCNQLGAPIRCNANNNFPGSNINGQVGLSTTSFINTVPGGTFGQSYCAAITATAPATYYIVLDNASTGYLPPQPSAGTVDGFTLNLAGSTAVFAGTVPPAYDSIPAGCNTANGITVYMDQGVACGSIAANGSDFSISPALATVTGATGVGCTGGTGSASAINLTFSNPLPPGTYTLHAEVGTDGNTLLNSCNVAQVVTDSIVFEAVALITVNAGTDTNICQGMSVPLAGTFSGGGVTNTVTWTPATGLSSTSVLNPIASPPTDQIYTLSVAPAGLPQCAVTDAVTVGVLQGFSITTPPTTICRGESVSITVSGDPRYTYSWAPPTGLSSTTTANTIATPDSTTVYTLTATYPGCSPASQFILITVEPVPTVFAGRDTNLCFGFPMQMMPTVTPVFSGYTYSWTPAAVFDSPSALAPRFIGEDSVMAIFTVTTPDGCKGTDSVIIDIVPKDFAEVSVDTMLCPRDTAQLRAGGGVRYRWTPVLGLSSDTVAMPLASPVTSTLYTVFVTDALGCRDTQFVEVVVHPGALLELPDSVRIHPGESYQMDPYSNCLYFKWWPPLGLTADSIANPVASPPVNTRYFVTASTAIGCTVRDSIDVYVDAESFVNVPNAFTPSGYGPNTLFKPERRGIVSIAYFRVYNRWGQKVFETNQVDAGWDGTFNGQPQPMGTFIWELDAVTSDGKRVKKAGNVTLLR